MTTTPIPSPEELPSLPRDAEGPVFAEPWQAQAFAMTVRLHEQGHFEWTEWATYLSDAITEADHAGGPSDGSDYYLRWLEALERLSRDKGLTSREALQERYDAWDAAAKATPHGQPIVLPS